MATSEYNSQESGAISANACDKRQSMGDFDQHSIREPTAEDGISTAGRTLSDKLNETVKDASQSTEKLFWTDSYKLAHADHGDKGAAQAHHNGETTSTRRDLGWNKPPSEIPSPLIGGVSNGTLWALIRRFNKVGLSS